MRYYDTTFDKAFDDAVDALYWEQKAKENADYVNIGNPQKLIGAQ